MLRTAAPIPAHAAYDTPAASVAASPVFLVVDLRTGREVYTRRPGGLHTLEEAAAAMHEAPEEIARALDAYGVADTGAHLAYRV